MKNTIIPICVFFILCIGSLVYSEGFMKISLVEIKKAADRELIKQGYDPLKMHAIYDESNSNRYINGLIGIVMKTEDLRIKIDERQYVVIMYQRKLKKNERIMGGDLYVFVDRSTGDVLLFLSGK